MSFQASVEKLNAPVKDLVVAFTENGTRHVGEAEKDKTEVAEWIEKAAQPDVAGEANIQSLTTTLTPRTYLVNNTLTAADVAIYGALHPYFSKLQPTQYYSHPSLTRFFDHIQSSPAVTPFNSAFGAVAFDLENAPAAERKAEPPKKKEKKPATAETESAVATPASSATPAPSEQPQKADKKEKKKKDTAPNEQSGKKAAAKAPAADEGSGEPVPSMIDLRVGKIVDIMKHPDADGLYVEQIDIGEETGPRTVVSGLVHYIPIEEMRDKILVAVCNLKPANMRGVKSFAMVLCATSKDGKEGGIELIQPPAGAKPGDKVYFEGSEYENATPLSQLNPKKKIFEAIQPGFITLETKEAAWVNPTTKSVHKIRTKDGLGQAARCFSSSARVLAHVSHIGREPIRVPENVTLTPTPTALSIKGPLGSTSVPLQPYMKLAFPEPNMMSVSVEDAEVKVQRQMWGTTRTLISNAITGITEGFTVPLYLVGVGYRAMLEDDPRGSTEGGNGKRLNMKLGYSHLVYVPIPAHIKAEVPSPTKIVISCTDKHQLGLFAAKVRSYRKPEPYKGKGIFVGNEQIRIKSVKKK
ncbi:hypothetical protein H0H92_002554 [Tricholoma furcatifolium]|nr:hypothetical protein H0H92_002554 [Tricholoma furcatifolium]